MPESVLRRRVAACAGTLMLFTAGLLSAAPPADAAVLAELRVEGPNGNLDPGTWYVTGKETIKRGRKPSCKKARGTRTFPGSTALGILGSADDVNSAIAPTRVRQTDLGPQMCGLGPVKSFGTYPNASAGWLYNVDYVSGFSSPDLATISDGDQVLWVYGVFPPADPAPPTGDEVNTGMALELVNVPPGDTDGSFQVKVVAHEFDGDPVDVNDATISGALSATPTGSGGLYNVTASEGFSILRAARGLDVASQPVKVCVDPDVGDCPSAHGRRIVGSPRSDALDGTAGWDDIMARRGDDRIDLSSGGSDAVSCGRGADEVIVAPGDSDNEINPDCEEVSQQA